MGTARIAFAVDNFEVVVEKWFELNLEQFGQVCSRGSGQRRPSTRCCRFRWPSVAFLNCQSDQTNKNKSHPKTGNGRAPVR